jgi:capsular polysaccharide export protein
MVKVTAPTNAPQKKSFLFLQGVSSPFFKRLAHKLEQDGHQVHKVSFNGGDLAYWAPRTSHWFRGALSELPSFLAEIYRKFGITDQVLFGDRRPVHQRAVEAGRQNALRNHVFEEGYFRPYWITLEREGVNARSQLPKDPDWYRRVGEQLLDAKDTLPVAQPFKSAFWRRAGHDVLYHTASALNPLLFPAYRTHALSWAPDEYVGYVRRQIETRLDKPPQQRDFSHWLEGIRKGGALYFLPLQLDSDFQVRDQPVLNSMSAVLEHVIASFARHAPASSCLLVKNHPLDDGRVRYPTLLARLIQQYDLADRVQYCEAGDLYQILACASGTVTLNSTVGSVALEHGCPTLCLADATYQLPGLTAQCGLDAFWTGLPAPDPLLFASFKAVVLSTTQVNGGFYCAQGIALAVQGSAQVLQAERSPLEVWISKAYA